MKHKLTNQPLPWYLGGALLFLYLNFFILPNTPAWMFADNIISLVNATRMFDGQVIYRDFFHFVPPGTELVYLTFFRLFGIHAWIPNLLLIVVGAALTWVTHIIARRVIPGIRAFLPGLMFLTFAYSVAFDGFHHWLSTLAIMIAIAVLIVRRTPVRLAASAALCGLASCFTSTQGFVAVFGLALFLLWEKVNKGQRWSVVLWREACLIATFLVALTIEVAYFSRQVGLAQFFNCTVLFVLRYYPQDIQWNSYRVYLSEVPDIRPWYHLPVLGIYLFIHVLIPAVYMIFVIRYLRVARVRPQEPWDALMLLNIMGLALFAGVAPAPDWVRLCTVSIPGLVLLAWLLHEPGESPEVLVRLLWFVTFMLALAEPGYRQTQWSKSLDLPRGRAAFLAPTEYNQFEWLKNQTRPSEFLFDAPFPDVYFLMGLRNPTETAFLTPTDYTRPEQVKQAVEALEEFHVRFVLWGVQLDLPYENRTGGDHLAPVRDYLRQHYRVVKTFPFEQV